MTLRGEQLKCGSSSVMTWMAGHRPPPPHTQSRLCADLSKHTSREISGHNHCLQIKLILLIIILYFSSIFAASLVILNWNQLQVSIECIYSSVYSILLPLLYYLFCNVQLKKINNVYYYIYTLYIWNWILICKSIPLLR